jgi:acetylornithine/succinyldiaminopimelate/putrescine aminotransferase
VPDQDKALPGELDAAIALASRIICSESFGVGEDALALIYEPILNVSGLLNPGEKFHNHVLKCARSVGAMLIADEIFTGYHKTGPFLASGKFSETCDFLVMSKAIANGFCPMSAVWGRDKWMDAEGFPPGEYSTTFANSPLNFIVAQQVLNRVNAMPDDAVGKVSNKLQVICEGLVKCASATGFSYKVNGLTAYVEHEDPDAVADLNSRLRARHILVASTGMSRTRLLLHPSVVFSEADLEETMSRLGSRPAPAKKEAKARGEKATLRTVRWRHADRIF